MSTESVEINELPCTVRAMKQIVYVQFKSSFTPKVTGDVTYRITLYNNSITKFIVDTINIDGSCELAFDTQVFSRQFSNIGM